MIIEYFNKPTIIYISSQETVLIFCNPANWARDSATLLQRKNTGSRSGIETTPTPSPSHGKLISLLLNHSKTTSSIMHIWITFRSIFSIQAEVEYFLYGTPTTAIELVLELHDVLVERSCIPLADTVNHRSCCCLVRCHIFEYSFFYSIQITLARIAKDWLGFKIIILVVWKVCAWLKYNSWSIIVKDTGHGSR